MSAGLSGKSVRRIEDPHLLRGETSYVGNLDLDGALVAHYVTSTEAHALIDGIDTSEAVGMPGVVDVVTAADIDLGLMVGRFAEYPEQARRPFLASDRVLYVGQAIAVVVAETEAQAADAAEQIYVDYDPLPAVIGFEAATSDRTLLYPDAGSNTIVVETGGSDGEPDFSDCEVVVEAEFVNQRIAPCPIEPRTAAAMWTDDGRLVQYASCQGVHPLQAELAGYYGLETADVRVITADVGGSFGAKIALYPEDSLLPLLAERTGRPVRWMPPRTADMVGMGHSRAQLHRVKIGGDADGTLKVLDIEVLSDCGAHPMLGLAMARNATRVQPGAFRMAKAHWTLRCVVTNTTPVVAYRGAGRPEGGALIDRAVDLFAAEIGMDQLEIRRLNLLREDELPHMNPTGVFYDTGDYHEALEILVGELGYYELRAEQVRRRANGAAKQLGIGLSTFIDRTAGMPGSEYGAVELKPDGSLRALTGSSPYGQGHYTTWAMLVADRTGVPFDQIEVVHGDTDVVPRGRITGGSRSVQKAGSAISLASDDLVAAACVRAADLLEAAVGDVVLDVVTGRFHIAGSPAAANVGWREIAAAIAAEDEAVGKTGERLLACEIDYEVEGATAPYGSYGAVVEVDTETGGVELIRMITVDDVGTVVNPMLALGQVHGGLAQAIGQALFEEMAYDADGNPLTSNFLDYAVPSAAELPSFECHLTEHPTPQNPLGAKGIGESGTIGGVPAVQNAVVDALGHLGVRHLDLPVTPQRVWRAIELAQSDSP
jgi:carbon-monoxide dehydrogenase large subunit